MESAMIGALEHEIGTIFDPGTQDRLFEQEVRFKNAPSDAGMARQQSIINKYNNYQKKQAGLK
jgi:hypothetical protein